MSLLSTGMVMALGLAALSVLTIRSFQSNLVDMTERTADLVGAYSVVELSFGAREESAATLAQLERNDAVIAATLYDASGEVFSEYRRSAELPGLEIPGRLTPPTPAGTTAVRSDAVDVVRPVEHDGVRLGTILVRSTTAPVQAQIRTLAFTLTGIVAALVLLALAFTAAIRTAVVKPINRVAAVAEQISAADDYSLRVPPEGYQEPAALAEGFNTMLAAIEDRQRHRVLAEKIQQRYAARLQLVRKLQAGILAGNDVETTIEAARRGLADLLPLDQVDALVFEKDTDPLEAITPPLPEEDATAVREVSRVVEVAFQQQELAEQIADHTRKLEQRVAERTAQLAAREATYRLVLMNADGLVVVDDQRRVRFANPAARELLGLPEELPPDTLFPVQLDPDDTGTFQIGETENPRTLETRTVAMDWNEEACVLASVRDITQQLAVERQLLETQKMAVVGQLAGGIAHDFNNLLMSIYGCVDLALLKDDLGPESGRLVRDIRSAAERASNLTRKLLDFSRHRDHAPESVELREFLTSNERMLARLLGDGIRLTLSLPEEDAWVLADPTELEQLLLNLAANSRDASETTGEVRIGLRDADDPACVQLHFEDDGPGIPPDVLPRVFEPFFTTKPLGQGTGMGLSTVFGIVRRAGGTIEVASEPGEGACFTITLPRGEQSSDPDVIAERPSGELPHRPIETVLVVDDDDQIRKLIVEGLGTQGYRVLDASGGEHALRTARELDDPIELLVTDLLMPGMDGVQLAREMQRHQPGIRCLFITGFGDDVFAKSGMGDAPAHLLEKPFRFEVLLAKVRSILDES